jgi:uncharacterized protein YyaL (SSP411 family)
MAGSRQNRLASEKSPYLLQHADNPVDWYPWGEEAFARASKENKPIFLSIGYSTCHWCHVMAHESFEDPEVAGLMNQAFVSIKVDREERPDIDKVYMAVCQMMTGSGGWPLTIIMAPDKRPFYAATYIPKEFRFGRPGMLDLLPYIQETWAERQGEVLDTAAKMEQALEKISARTPGSELNEATLRLAYEQLAAMFDETSGGFGKEPKFPTPHNLSFLLRYWKRSNDKKALEMVERTLRAMRSGGIYDHIGFGFHRYSTDSSWLVPHFEKMLYDQSLLAIAYIEAYQATGREEYAATARQVLDYVLRDMTAPEGGFYSAEDADSEGEEGRFYLWTFDEIRQALSEEEANLAVRLFNIKKGGNFSDEATGNKSGRNILHLSTAAEEPAAAMDTVRQKLFERRRKRIHPLKDDKILADWNGLMVAAMARAGRILDEPRYINAAGRAIGFIFGSMWGENGRLLHRYREEKAELEAYIDDYAFIIWGLLELYEATFDAGYLKQALSLNDITMQHFWDSEDGGFFFTARDGEPLLTRQKEGYDGAIPSGNSVSMLNLLRLGRITSDSALEDRAAAIGRVLSAAAARSPAAHAQLMIALDFALGPTCEVVVAGDSQAEGTKTALATIQKHFIPNKVVMLRPTEVVSPEIDKISPVSGYKASRDGRVNIFVCSDYKCQSPTTDICQALESLEVK